VPDTSYVLGDCWNSRAVGLKSLLWDLDEFLAKLLGIEFDGELQVGNVVDVMTEALDVHLMLS